MKLSNENKRVLMLELNEEVNKSSEDAICQIRDVKIKKDVVYPPNNELTENEMQALEKISTIPHSDSALKKVIANATALSIFNFLNIIDGTGDPSNKFGKWTGVALVDLQGDSEDESDLMLHDNFFESYWDWEKFD